MKPTIKIARKMLQNGPVHTSPLYVSNGHWIVRRADLHETQKSDDALRKMLSHGYAVREMTDVQLDKFFTTDDDAQWTVTGWSYDVPHSDYTLRVVERFMDGGAERAYIRADYLELMHVAVGDTIIGSKDGMRPFLTADRSGCVMGHRMDSVVALASSDTPKPRKGRAA